ncbi:MAG: hypothetical protein J6W16_07185 [Methanobrevibacter sp.]|nr:hypothetical protein [Methanobrevibacter sp.]MBP5785347.1 hypothetical protein [Methanobrevibacter sp.]
MDGIFDEEFEAQSQNTELEKALEAGYGTDAAAYTQGRSLQREDLEATLVTVLDVKQKDLKLFHKLHKQPVTSTVHQVERQTDVGDDEFLFVGESEKASEGDPTFQRKIYETKYTTSKWEVSHPLSLTDNVENAINASKVAAVMRVSKGTERCIFHGNSAASPKQYDGLLKIIEDSAKNTSVAERLRATVMDIRGLEIGETDTIDGETIDAGEALFDDIAEKVYSKGGDLAEAYFPPVVSRQFKNMFSSRLRLSTKDEQFAMDKLPKIITATNSVINITDDAGADKMFRVKGPVVAAGNSSKRPNTPTSITGVAASDSASKFTTAYAGNYVYGVHAINAYGISAAATSSSITVAAGEKVTLTITPSTNGEAATGFIITRSKAGGSSLMEMVRVANSGNSTTVVVDFNEDLPGTAQVVLLTPTTDEMRPNASFGQLMGMSNFDLPTDSSLAHRGVVALYGMLEVRAPEYCAMIKNVGYTGGLY